METFSVLSISLCLCLTLIVLFFELITYYLIILLSAHVVILFFLPPPPPPPPPVTTTHFKVLLTLLWTTPSQDLRVSVLLSSGKMRYKEIPGRPGLVGDSPWFPNDISLPDRHFETGSESDNPSSPPLTHLPHPPRVPRRHCGTVPYIWPKQRTRCQGPLFALTSALSVQQWTEQRQCQVIMRWVFPRLVYGAQVHA